MKVEQRKYKKLLWQSKRDAIRNKVNECGKDAKKLYTLVAELTGSQTENPLPPGRDDKELCEDFAHFFINKIKNIRDDLSNHPMYVATSSRDISTLDNFQE